jgi:hypothetical protein
MQDHCAYRTLGYNYMAFFHYIPNKVFGTQSLRITTCEDLLRPALIGVIVVFLSTLFWIIQANPTHEPSFSHVIGFTQSGNGTRRLKVFERRFADFLPLFSLNAIEGIMKW